MLRHFVDLVLSLSLSHRSEWATKGIAYICFFKRGQGYISVRPVCVYANFRLLYLFSLKINEKGRNIGQLGSKRGLLRVALFYQKIDTFRHCL
jgi:hypothetical protein